MTPDQRQQRATQQEARMYAELDAEKMADKPATDRFNAIVRMSARRPPHHGAGHGAGRAPEADGWHVP